MPVSDDGASGGGGLMETKAPDPRRIMEILAELWYAEHGYRVKCTYEFKEAEK